MYPSPSCAARKTTPMMMKVRVNCRSINPAAEAAPTGSHHVLASKKYVLASVISQINSINARPIPQPSRAQKDFPTAVASPTARANGRRRVYHSHLRIMQSSFQERNIDHGIYEHPRGEPTQQLKNVMPPSDPQTQTDRGPRSPLPKSPAQYRTWALHIRKNETPHVRRRDPLPWADRQARLRRTRGQRMTDPVFLNRYTSTSLASRRQSSPSLEHLSAAPTAEISVPAPCFSFVSSGRRVHLRETDRRMQLLQPPRRAPSRRPEPSATRILHWSKATAKEPPRVEARPPQLVARPTRAALHAWQRDPPLR